jgi:hypothetical protein
MPDEVPAPDLAHAGKDEQRDRHENVHSDLREGGTHYDGFLG